jgi:hypothetical protein
LIKIKIYDVAPKGACSFYRGWGVLSKLHKLRSDIIVEFETGISWNHLIDCDILYLVRPVENNYIESIEMAKNFGVIVWSDFDDLLPEIPEDNPSYNYFTSETILKNVETAIKNSDIVTVSSELIKEYYKKINPDIIVIENAFNDYNLKFEKRTNEKKRIMWRGSDTHRKDLLSCKDGMISINSKYPDWNWVFIGSNPWYITDEIKNSIIVSELELIKYNKFIKDIAPAITIIPLVDNLFNRAKSNCSWIEGTYAGSCCIAPDLPEFQKDGCINYDNNFEYLLEKTIKSKSFRQENYNKSFEYIHDNLLLSKINQKRIQIIEKVCK